MNNTINSKVLGALVSAAFLSVFVYAFALFHVAPTHAASPLYYSNVEIDDGSMMPIALNITAPDLNVGVQANTNTNANVNTSANASVNTNANVSAQSNTSATPTATPAATNAAEVTTGVNAAMTAQDATIDVPANINTTDDVNLYAKSVEAEDKDISNVNVGNDNLTVSYREPAKFLGFIPVTVTANAVVNSDGTVSLKYPWYTFLSMKNDAQLKADLQANVAEIMANEKTTADASANSTVGFSQLSARSQAELIAALHAAFKSSMNTNTSVTTNTTANTNTTTY